jgi:hypothetical protein
MSFSVGWSFGCLHFWDDPMVWGKKMTIQHRHPLEIALLKMFADPTDQHYIQRVIYGPTLEDQ